MKKVNAQVDKLLKLVRAIRDVEAEFPPQSLEILLMIAAEGTLGMSDIQERISIPMSLGAVSRNLRKLAVSHNGRKGFGFVTVSFAPGTFRQKEATMTPKGLSFIDRLLAIEA